MTNIILNEKEAAISCISDRCLGKNIYVSLCCVAKYYKSLGFSRADVSSSLQELVMQCVPNTSLCLWERDIQNAISCAWKRKMIEIESIDITQAEVDTIKSVRGVNGQSVAFTMLCLAKYWKHVSEEYSGWINTDGNDVCKLANVNGPKNYKCDVIGRLREMEIIKSSSVVGKNNYCVLFMNDASDVVLSVTDFRNLGNQWHRFSGEQYIECEVCGIVVKKNGRRDKYCRECAKEIDREKSLERWRNSQVI